MIHRRMYCCAGVGLLLFGLLHPLQAEPDPGSAAAAATFTDHAYQLLLDGEPAGARDLAERALRYNPAKPDAHAVIALSFDPDSDQTLRIVQHLYQALEDPGPHRISRIELQLLLGRLLLRMDRVEDAARILPPVSDVGLPRRDVLTAQVMLAYASSDYRRGDDLLQEGLRLYPDSPELIDILLQRDPVPHFFTRAYIEHGLQQSPLYRRAVLRMAETRNSYADREQLLQRYYALGGQSARASWLRLLDAVSQQLERSELETRFQRFMDDGGMRRWDLVYELLQTELPDYLLESIDARLRDYTGRIYWYQPYHSMPEQWLQLRNGNPVRWYLDQTADGQANLEIGFVEGMPHQAVLRTGEQEYLYNYHFYPWVIGIQQTLPEDAIYYSMIPFTLELPMFEQLPVGDGQSWAAQRIRAGDRWPQITADRQQYRYSRKELDDGRVRTRWYRDGITVRDEYRTEEDVLIRLVEYRQGARHRGSESLSHDGYFDMAELYDQDDLIARAFDTNRDGQADVWERFDERRTQIWKLGSQPLIGAVLHDPFAPLPEIDIFYGDDTSDSFPTFE
ncbi:hypothetical protein [Spirochaeta africana]|uniref:Tetratricopeptide repeat protein n=1 Tax=Spirochaeta africana (strain ATCC 700263 / DSM 8902 / Z-7692) TaxID=889378 RepID=H9UK84_SPIAZ|nr:hypothetical protein [Spirochaeta africana]AFG37927.1 hypothetical protein Spiaf_1872 [Spirochaeta africana DSM 8902]